jgi:hypothetical protein
MIAVRERLQPHLLVELHAASIASKELGPAVASQSAIAHAIFAALVQGNPYLFHFDQQGTPEESSEQLPFAAIGSGQAIADPFLAFIRRVFWSDSLLLGGGDGTFAVLWTFLHPIQTNPGGVAEPIQIDVLTAKGARELTDAELVEHRQNIQAVEEVLKNYKKSFTSLEVTASPVPTPPSL